jgi:NADH-quinone oxidoreductase subunit L
VVWFPLVMLAIPSVIIGPGDRPMLFGDFFKGVIFVGENHHAMEELAHEFHGPVAMAIHALTSLPLWLAIRCGCVVLLLHDQSTRTGLVLRQVQVPAHPAGQQVLHGQVQRACSPAAHVLGNGLWNVGDKTLIDGLLVNGSAKLVGWFSTLTRLAQTGYIYHYAFVMILGILGFLVYFLPFWHA